MDPLSQFLIELAAGLAGKALEEILEALPRRLRKSVQDDPAQKDALRIALKAGLEAAGRNRSPGCAWRGLGRRSLVYPLRLPRLARS